LRDAQRAATLFISVPRLWLKFRACSPDAPTRADRLLAIPLLGRLVARKVLRAWG
jgi:long-chain acyl-CoA synthetase